MLKKNFAMLPKILKLKWPNMKVPALIIKFTLYPMEIPSKLPTKDLDAPKLFSNHHSSEKKFQECTNLPLNLLWLVIMMSEKNFMEI